MPLPAPGACQRPASSSGPAGAAVRAAASRGTSPAGCDGCGWPARPPNGDRGDAGGARSPAFTDGERVRFLASEGLFTSVTSAKLPFNCAQPFPPILVGGGGYW